MSETQLYLVAPTRAAVVPLRDACRTRGYMKRGLETDLNGQRRIPLRGRESRRSVQAQDPYDLPQRAAAFDQTISRLKRVSALS